MGKHIQIKPHSKSDRIFDLINKLFIMLTIFVCAYPIYFSIIASVSDPQLVVSGGIILWPQKITMDSYRAIMRHQVIWVGYKNSIVYSILGTLWNLILLLPASYAMSKQGLKFKNILMVYFIFTMYFSGGMIPTYLLFKNIGLIDNPLIMILPGAFSVYNMIITKTFFQSNFSESLREAAKIDGANELRVFLQIALPLSGSIIAVMSLFSAVGHWNSYFNALLYLNSSKYYPLQLIMRQILIMNQSITADVDSMSAEDAVDMLRRQLMAETMKYSLIIVANLPVLMAYPFVQKYFVKGVMIGSVKG